MTHTDLYAANMAEANARIAELEAELAAVTKQRDELVEAARQFLEADEDDAFVDIVEDSEGHIENAAEVREAAVRRGHALKRLRELARQDLPAYQPEQEQDHE
jgi:predicted transcriptional regulator